MLENTDHRSIVAQLYFIVGRKKSENPQLPVNKIWSVVNRKRVAEILKYDSFQDFP